MTIDEAEKMAREVNAHVYHNDQYGEPTDACLLARFVLAVLPVVKAAENCLPDPESRRYAVFADVKDYACSVCAPGNDFPNKTWRCARHELTHAIDQMRRDMEDK